MKLEVGKKYQTKDGHIVKLVDKREYADTSRYLGIIDSKNYAVYWYNEKGRLFNEGISPNDIQSEFISKIVLFTRLDETLFNKLLTHKYIGMLGQKIKITLELDNE